MAIDPTPVQLDVISQAFRLLSSPVRLHLVVLAAEGERDVTSLAQAAGVTLTTASQHLSKMRLAGLVSARREGRTIVRQMFEHIAPDGTLAPDPPGPLG